VFAVGYLGDWRGPAAVLLEPESVRGHSAPRRQAGEEVAGTFTSRARSGGWGQDVDHYIPDTVGALTDGAHNGGGLTDRTRIPAVSLCLNAGGMGRIS
jgi:DNA (cytosine-5)-methyltransferase 1